MESRKSTFVLPKSGRVVITSAIDMFGRVGNMKHLMKENVFDNKPRNSFRVERPTDRYGVMSRVMMSKNVIALAR